MEKPLAPRVNNKPLARRRNSSKTKEAIIAAAQNVFAEHGYSQAGVREIAANAGGISTSLIVRYFGSKAGLFEATLLDAIQLNPILGPDKSQFGQRLARIVLDQTSNIRLAEMVVLSAGDATARRITAKVTQDHIIRLLARWLGGAQCARARHEHVYLGDGLRLVCASNPRWAVTARDGKLVRRGHSGNR